MKYSDMERVDRIKTYTSKDELAVMDGDKCILQLRGVRPFFSGCANGQELHLRLFVCPASCKASQG